MNTNRNTADLAEDSSTSRLVDSVDQMVRWPFQMTGATWDFMMQGMQNMTGQRSSGNRNNDTSSWTSNSNSNSGTNSSANSTNSSGSSWTSAFTGQNDQDLSGDDLKYVLWSIAFTRPGFEAVLEPQHEEIVNYSADAASYAAVKIAKFLESARHGRCDKPESWGESYPTSTSTNGRRTETITVTPAAGVVVDTGAGSAAAGRTSAASGERGWRIPAEDQKYITFLYRVDRRLPRQEVEVTRVERVTIERGGTAKIV